MAGHWCCRCPLQHPGGRRVRVGPADQRSGPPGGQIDLAVELSCEPAALAQASAVIISSDLPAGSTGNIPPAQRAALKRRRAARSRRRRSPGRCRPVTRRSSRPGGGTWPLLVLAALRRGHGIPLDRAHRPGHLPVPGQRGAGPAGSAAGLVGGPRRWSGRAARHRCGTGAPPAVWMSPALQASVRAAAAGPAGPGGPRGGRCAGGGVAHQDQPGSPLAAVLRSCAASLRQAAGDVLWAAAAVHRVLLAAGQSLDAAGLPGPAAAWWQELTAAQRAAPRPGATPDTVVAAGLLAAALLAAGQAGEAVTWSEWVLVQPRRACSARITPPRSRRRSAWAARWRPPASPPGARRPGGGGAAQRAGLRARRRRHGGRAGGVRRRVAGRGQDRRGDPAVQAAAGRRGEAPARTSRHRWPAGCGWPTPCWPRARPRTPSPSTRGVLAGRERALGPDHPDTLAARAGLAPGVTPPGRWAPRCTTTRRRAPGTSGSSAPVHPGTLACRADLARAYAAVGQVGEAVTLLRGTIARSEQALSPGDPLTWALRQASGRDHRGDDRPVTAAEGNAVTDFDYIIVGGGHGRLRAGRPAHRGPRHPGAAAGSRQRGADPRHDRAGRLARPARQRRRTGLCHQRRRPMPGRCPTRAAGRWAGPARSTPWPTSAATGRSTTPGPRPGRPAGDSRTCCRTSGAASTPRAGTRRCAAPAARSGSPRSPRPDRHPVARRVRRGPAARSAARPPMTSAAAGRRGWPGPTWPSPAGGGSARPTPTWAPPWTART